MCAMCVVLAMEDGPAQLGYLYLFLPPAGRNKGLFVLWRVWSLQEKR